MKINSTGAPLWVTGRKGKGLAIRQGGNRVALSPTEVPALLQAIADLAPDGGWPTGGLEDGQRSTRVTRTWHPPAGGASEPAARYASEVAE